MTSRPGWSATDNGRPVPIRPAYVAFRAVYLTKGRHTVVFTYRPAGFVPGLALSACGILLIMLATARFVRTTNLIDRQEILAASSVRAELIVSAVLVLLVASYSIYLAVA